MSDINPYQQNIPNTINFIDSIESFFKEEDLKEKSKQTYRKAFKHFLKFLLENDIKTPQRSDVINYKASLQGKSPYTISSYLTAVRKLFTWTEAIGLYPNIAKGIKGAKIPQGFNKDTLTIKQVKHLLDSIPREEEINLRDFALINLLIRTGLRTIEVSRANIEDMRQHGGKAVLYIQGKGRDSKDNFVILTEEAISPIHNYLASRKSYNDKSPLFAGAGNRNKGKLTTESISRIIKSRLRKASIDNNKITAHSLRHTAITLSLLAGASLQEAKELARHTNINTTMIYSHNINRLNDNAPEYLIAELLRKG